jgi:hypothetical protein
MPDTVRSLADILTLLADNASGDISPQDLRDAVVSLSGNYSQLVSTGGSKVLSSAHAKFDLWTSTGPESGCATGDHATNRRVTVSVDGTYDVSFNISGPSYANFRAWLRVNNTTNLEAMGGSLGEYNWRGLLTLSAGDYVELFVNNSGTGFITTNFTAARLVVTRVK